MSKRKTIKVDVWLVQFASDRSTGVLADGCIKPSLEKAEKFAADMALLPWVSCISITKLRQTIPIYPQVDTSDASITQFIFSGEPVRRH